MKKGLPFAWDLSLEISEDSYLCFPLTSSLHSVSYFFFFYQSPSLSLCMVFHSISSNIDEVLSINPSANVVFVFEILMSFTTQQLAHIFYIFLVNCHHFSILNDLTQQMVNFPTLLPDCDSLTVLLFGFISLSSDTSIYSTMAFLPLQNSDHISVSVSIDYPLH